MGIPSSISCSLLGADLLNGIVTGMPPHILNVPLSLPSEKQVQWMLYELRMPTPRYALGYRTCFAS